MIVLGLGANVGDRLQSLRLAFQKLNALPGLIIKQTSPVYQSDALLPENAPADWNHPYLNCALRCETTLTPEALLPELKKIEWSIGRKPAIRHWGPRVIDIDILAFDERVIQTEALTLPHASLFERPFALWPLADVAPDWVCPLQGPHFGKTASELAAIFGSRYDGLAPFHTRQLATRIDTPVLVGILNITPDSFSDGGQFLNVDAALDHAKKLVTQGASVLDVGAVSTAPHSVLLNENEEWARLQPILTAIISEKNNWDLPPLISVDTQHARTAARAIELGIDWINDQSALSSKAMVEILCKSQHDIVLMHHLTLPANPKEVLPPTEDVIAHIKNWAEKKIAHLEKNGIEAKRLILDPGIGFGKSAAQSLHLIKHAEAFKTLGCRLLIGHSRKSFMNTLTPYAPAERDIETAAMAPMLAAQGVDYLRVHNVDTAARVLSITAALSQ